MVIIPFQIWHETDTYARNKNDTIRLTIPTLDHGTDESTGREDQILLPDDFFVNLLDIDLQKQILNAKDLDINIKNMIKTIKKNRPTNLLNNITDWKIEEVDGQKTIFYKGMNYSPKDQDL